MNSRSFEILIVEDNPGDAFLVRRIEDAALHFDKPIKIQAYRVARGVQGKSSGDKVVISGCRVGIIRKMMKTKGQIEADVSEAIIKFEKEYMGRGPVETRTYLIDDMIIVRLQGVITRAEYHLATSGDNGKGRELIKQTRMQLIEKARPLLEAAVHSILGVSVKSLHTDISTITGERLIIFTLERCPDCLGG